jgi:hypothetical protein
MAETITDYKVIFEGFFILQQVLGGPVLIDNVLHVGLPDDFVPGTNTAKPVIQFKVRSFAENSRLVITVNGGVPSRDNSGTMQTSTDTVFDRLFDPAPLRTHYTFASGDKFFAGSTNTIIFSINANQGDNIQIEDVMIWYQRRI